jgi:transcriptional regulator GlxA family with amidase domain
LYLVLDALETICVRLEHDQQETTAMGKSTQFKVGFLIFPGFPMACLTSMIEPLRAANEIAGLDSFEWKLVSETGAKVVSSAQVVFEPDCSLTELDGSDMLFLLSGPNAVFDNPTKGHGKLRMLSRHGCTLGGISGGIFPLVRAGLMHGHRCSVHWCYETAFRAEFPEIDATDQVIVTDNQRVTASGAAAAFDLALHIIDQHFGPEIAHEVACWFQHNAIRSEDVRQRVPMPKSAHQALPGLAGKAAALFAARIEEPITVAEVAAALNVTPRQIERSFKKATGLSPSHYYRALRMKAARQLVLYSKETFGQIAATVGYATATPLAVHYEAAFGFSPKQDRARINGFRMQSDTPLPSV